MMGISLERRNDQSLSLQLTMELRKAVTGGGLIPGDRLPPSRTLAKELGVSRNLVLGAYEQLIAEGFLAGEVGRGTYVTTESGQATQQKARSSVSDSSGSGEKPIRYDFTAGRPDLRAIPKGRWSECLADTLRNDPTIAWTYGPAQGEEDLRRQIASWLFRIRGVEVNADEVIITSGTAQSLLLLSLAVGGSETVFHCENPSIPYARQSFRQAGASVEFLSVDEQGAKPPQKPGSGNLCYLTPSHQFPRGTRLGLERRMAFLEWAEIHQGLLVEDDYDSEFRYTGLPITPMVSLAPNRVVYLGTFSKVLFPALRIAYLIAPAALHDRLLAVKGKLMMQTPRQNQHALARFMERGWLDKHVVAMKKTYRERSQAITEFLNTRFPGNWDAQGTEGGYHWFLAVKGKGFDQGFFDRCRNAGIAIKGEGHYREGDGILSKRLVLGFGNLRDDRIQEGLESLAHNIDGI